VKIREIEGDQCPKTQFMRVGLDRNGPIGAVPGPAITIGDQDLRGLCLKEPAVGIGVSMCSERSGKYRGLDVLLHPICGRGLTVPKKKKKSKFFSAAHTFYTEKKKGEFGFSKVWV
jgi:hypothetical protein